MSAAAESPTIASNLPQAGKAGAPAKPKKKVFIIPLVLLIAGGLVAWRVIAGQGHESTDNAQVEAEIVPVPSRAGGLVVEVLVADNQRVEAGQPLARLDDVPARTRVAQAEAALAAAEASAKAADATAVETQTNAQSAKEAAAATRATADATAVQVKVQIREAEAAIRAAQASFGQAKTDYDREKDLFDAGASPKSALDAASTRVSVAGSNLEAAKARLATLRAGVSQAETRIGEADVRVAQTSDVDTLIAEGKAKAQAAHAQVEAAKAVLALARLDLEWTVIKAPRAGVVSKKSVLVGMMLQAGQTVAQLVSDERWVTANFKETQLADMRVGQPVAIEVDAFPDADIAGELESFAGGTGARFTLLPPDNATGNFTKVVQRVPVRIKLTRVPRDVPLVPGLSAVVSVDTREGHGHER